MALLVACGGAPQQETTPKPAHEREQAQARALYRRCQAGAGAACAELGRLYRAEGPGLPLSKRMRPAIARACGPGAPKPRRCFGLALLARACDAGDGGACADVALALEHGDPGPVDRAAALAHQRRACSAGVGASCHELGLRALRGDDLVARDVSVATELLDAACRKDGALGCTELGRIHERGLGREPDAASAAALFERGCDNRSAEGCFELGRLNERGRASGRPDATRALDRYTQACELDLPDGCLAAARVYQEAAGADAVAKLVQQALAGFRGACERGDDHACSELGQLLRDGRGVAQNEEEGLALQARACAAGHAPGCLAWMSRGGDLVMTGDGPDVLPVLSAACDRGEAQACFAIGRMGKGPWKQANRLPPEDPYGRACAAGSGAACNVIGIRTFPPDDKGRRALERACALGDAPGCHHLGMARERAGEDGHEAYERACEWRWGRACTRLGQAVLRGEIAADADAAKRRFERGCDLGDAAGCGSLGELHLDGRGSLPDAVRGVELLAQACRGDFAPACIRLGKRALGAEARNANEAEAMLTRGCQLGDGRGCLELARGLDGETLDRDTPRALELAQGAGQIASRRCSSHLSECRSATPWTELERRWERWAGEPAYVLTGEVGCEAPLEGVCSVARQAHELACSLGDAKSCWEAATMHQVHRREGLGGNEERANELAKEAFHGHRKLCDKRDARACLWVADAFRRGTGTRVNETQAKQHEQRACRADKSLCR